MFKGTSASSVSDQAFYPGFKGEFSTALDFLYPENLNQIQCYRVMDRRGNIIKEDQDPEVVVKASYKTTHSWCLFIVAFWKLDKDTLLRMYEQMALLTKLDQIMYEAQRQGRISFYMTNHGEVAAQVGSSVALDPKDMIYAQYREAGEHPFLYFTWR